VAPAINLDDQETALRCDLHRSGADLWEGIEIVASPPGELVVQAWGVSPQRKDELVVLLSQRAGVKLEFQVPEGCAATCQAVVVGPSAAPPRPRVQRLISFFRSAAAEDNYARSVLQVSTNIQYLHALRGIARRWPPEKEAELSAGAQAQLATLVQDYAPEVRPEVSGLKTELDLLLECFDYPRRGPFPWPTNWQHASACGFGGRAARGPRRALASHQVRRAPLLG
jgi:hypothetical protein